MSRLSPENLEIKYDVQRENISAEDTVRTLLCDPLTGLVAYPCFERLMVELYPSLREFGFSIAIGDVDDLTGYVIAEKHHDPYTFGHLAGNHCMQKIGAITRLWHDRWRRPGVVSVCATFGGDEVIILTQTVPDRPFVDLVQSLSGLIEEHAPRPCTFAVGEIGSDFEIKAPDLAYQYIVSSVDKALFNYKSEMPEERRAVSMRTLDLGKIELGGPIPRGHVA